MHVQRLQSAHYTELYTNRDILQKL